MVQLRRFAIRKRNYVLQVVADPYGPYVLYTQFRSVLKECVDAKRKADAQVKRLEKRLRTTR